MKKKISVVINTKNSQETLKETLESVKFANEIVVVDMQSTDKTVEIASRYTNNIYKHKKYNYVEPARNYAISKAKYEWLLIVDSDEVVTDELKKEISRVISLDNKINAYRIARKNIIFSKWIKHTGWWPDYQLRLFRRKKAKWSDDIHSKPQIKGKIGTIVASEKKALIHDNYRTIEQYVSRMNRYTNISSDIFISSKQDKKNDNLFDSFFDQFFYRFFAKQGYLDGKHGVALSLLQSMYELCIKLKIWQKNNFRDNSNNIYLNDLINIKKKFSYHIADAKYKTSRNLLSKTYWQIRRKFKI